MATVKVGKFETIDVPLTILDKYHSLLQMEDIIANYKSDEEQRETEVAHKPNVPDHTVEIYVSLVNALNCPCANCSAKYPSNLQIPMIKIFLVETLDGSRRDHIGYVDSASCFHNWVASHIDAIRADDKNVVAYQFKVWTDNSAGPDTQFYVHQNKKAATHTREICEHNSFYSPKVYLKLWRQRTKSGSCNFLIFYSKYITLLACILITCYEH